MPSTEDEVDARLKCELVLGVIDGVEGDFVSSRLEEEVKKASQAAGTS